MTAHAFFDLLPPRMKMAGKSYFTVRQRADGGYIVDVRRMGSPAQSIFCETEADANRARLRLSDDGLVGFVQEG